MLLGFNNYIPNPNYGGRPYITIPGPVYDNEGFLRKAKPKNGTNVVESDENSLNNNSTVTKKDELEEKSSLTTLPTLTDTDSSSTTTTISTNNP